MSDNKTKITAELDLAKAEKQMKEFLKTDRKIKLTVDTSPLNKARSELNALSNITIKPKIDTGGISGAASNITREFRQIQTLASQISSTKLQLGGIDTGGLAGVQGQIKQIAADYQALGNTLNNNTSLNQSNSFETANTSGKGFLDTLSQINTVTGGIRSAVDVGKFISSSMNLD